MTARSRARTSIPLIISVVVILTVAVVIVVPGWLFDRGGGDAPGARFESVEDLAQRVDDAGFDCSETFESGDSSFKKQFGKESGYCLVGGRTVPLIVSDDERQLELFDTLRHIHPHLVKGPNWKIATRNKDAAESIAEELGARLIEG